MHNVIRDLFIVRCTLSSQLGDFFFFIKRFPNTKLEKLFDCGYRETWEWQSSGGLLPPRDRSSYGNESSKEFRLSAVHFY